MSYLSFRTRLVRSACNSISTFLQVLLLDPAWTRPTQRMAAMEGTMQTIDRLIEAMNGEDPGGARIYMSQLRENETLAMLECFEDMLSGKLSVLNPSDSQNGSCTGMAYRVPPSEFLKVLLEGNTTRLGALHAVLQAAGRGDLQGRAASLCISEVRMCLAACSGGANNALAPHNERAGSCGSSFQSSHVADRRIPLGHLRELAGVCLSFSMDFSPAFGLSEAGRASIRGLNGGEGRGEVNNVRGRRRGREVANNRRILMLDALPAVLSACCTANDVDDSNSSSSSECDSSDCGDEYQTASLGLPTDGRKKAGKTARAPTDSRDCGDDRVCTTAGKKKKGKRHWDHVGGGGIGSSDRRNFFHLGTNRRRRTTHPKRAVSLDLGSYGGGLPERGEAVLWEVVDALLDRPWPPELALPLLVMFEEIHPLVEMLGPRANKGGSTPAVGGWADNGEQVWVRVRSRLMECVWMGGMDGADFTGVLRQVCFMCQTECHRRFEQNFQRSSSFACQEQQKQPRRDIEASECGIRTLHVQLEDADTGKEVPRDADTGISEVSREAPRARRVDGGTGRGSSSWLSCLRRLHAAVPPECLSTVELVLEQTLHQMPDVAESLLDTIQASSIADGERPCGSRPLVPGTGDAVTTSIDDDLGLLLLLLREASPLRACSLPLLPDGADRGRRAEEGVMKVLLVAARGGGGSRYGIGYVSGASGRAGNDVFGVREVLKGVLCSRRGVVNRTVSGGSSSSGYGAGYSSCDGRGAVSWTGEGECSGVASERASQLLELSLRWLEEGEESAGSGYSGVTGSGSGSGDGTSLSVENLASETISAVFDTVGGARPMLLRSLLSGVFDQSQGGASCAPSYLRAWEALMTQEAKQQCRRLTPHSQIVSDALGRLTLLPRGRARRVVESMLPLADACAALASALISLCRKCAAQGENKGRLFALHTVACIFAWNARRPRRGGCGGCLDQEGMREDLVAMFRRALEGGLQTTTRADTLHLLASKVAMPSPGWMPLEAAEWANSTTTLIEKKHPQRSTLSPPLRGTLDPDPPPAIDFVVLKGLRELLTARLFRFFARKDELLLDNESTSGVIEGLCSGVGVGPGDDGGGCSGGYHQHRGKGKRRARGRGWRLRVGHFQLVPLRLLENGYTHDEGYSHGQPNARPPRVRGGVVPRDAIGHLVKCCWALVPHSGGSLDVSLGSGSSVGNGSRVMAGPGKRTETEAIARAVLGSAGAAAGVKCGQERGEMATAAAGGAGFGVCTREGEALVAVVEFLEGGGGMETIRLAGPSGAHASASLGVSFDHDYPQLSDLVSPPPCNPGLVGPLPALAIVVTLAEALVDCLLSGVLCPPAMPFLRPNPRYATTPLSVARSGREESGGWSSGRVASRAGSGGTLVLWAVADVFTVLAAAARAAEGIAGSAGFAGQQQQQLLSSSSKTRSCPETLSEIIVLLPAEMLGLSRGTDVDAAAGGGCATAGDDDDEDGAPGKGVCGNLGGVIGDAAAVQCPLFSASSAVVFVKEFLLWAAAVRVASAEGTVSPARAVAEAWDAGIGVWLGLTHSVRALATALEVARGGGENRKGDNEGEARNRCKEPSVERWEASVAGASDGPSSEAIALVVFELRAIIGTPSAALHVLDPFSSEAAGASVSASRASRIDDNTTVDNGGGGTCSTRRPPPGTMVKGFLRRMNERWKAHLDWGLPGAVPPRRSSARLESSGRRRRDGGFGGGYGGNSPASQNLRAEAEDSYFALRGELLRAQRLALSALLVGPGASAATRRWAARAALISAERRSFPEKAGGGDAYQPGRNYPTLAHSGDVVAREEPEAGSGPARGGSLKKVGPVHGLRSSRRHAGTGGDCQESASKVATADARRRRPRAIHEDNEGQRDSSSDGDLGSGRRHEGRVLGVDVAGACARQAVGNEGVEGEEWDALGRLCRLAAVEMREGLENGLSVKLTQAYLDLVELLGNASLEHRHPASASMESKGSQTTATNPEDDHSSGDDEEDAGGVLLSIITCHCVGQVNLFKRFVRGAVRYDGVGADRRHPSQRVSKAVVMAELEARDREISQGISDGTSCDATLVEVEAAAVVGRIKVRSTRRRTLERCSRMLVHCIRWIRSRGGKRFRSANPFAEKDDAAGESCDESNVGENTALSSSGHDRASRRSRDAELEDDDSDNSSEDESGGRGGGGTDTGRRYSSRPNEVKFESSRECYAAMHAMLVEIEAALVSAGSLGGGSDSNTVTTSSGDDVDLASIIATVSEGLREFFEPIAEAATASVRLPTEKKRENVAETTDHGPESSTLLTAAAAATASPERKRWHRKRRGDSSSGATAEAEKKKKKKRPVPADLFPEHMKLLLMRVLERLYLVGRACAMTAASVLVKSPRSACVATAFARMTTGAAKAEAAMSSPSTPRSLRFPLPPPPSSSKRRRQSRTVENAGKPGDQAGGGPAKRGGKASGGGYGYDKCDDKQDMHISTGRASGTYLNSSTPPTDDGFHSPLPERGRGHDDRSSNITNAIETRSKVTAASTNEVHDARDSAHLILATILPVLAIASGDSLQLMAMARAWAEARRSRKKTGEDSCRKRASTLLFKMDRCELEIGRAAQRARHFLDDFHLREVPKNGDAVTKSESKGGHAGGRGGVKSAKKRARVAGGGKKGAAVNDSADAVVTTHEVTTKKCDDTIERALRLLLSGVDTLAVRRREFSARENEILVERGRRRGGKSQKRRRAQAGVRIIPSEDEDDTVLLDEEESAGVGKEVELGRNSQGALAASRRKSARSRMRLRSRNAWIDGWLAEGGEEGGDGGDAFVDLEDFIED